MKITKDMNITDIVRQYPDTMMVFMYAGMGCFGCHAAQFESLNEIAEASDEADVELAGVAAK